MHAVFNIIKAYVLAFVVVLTISFGRGYIADALDAGDRQLASTYLVFGIVFSLAPAILVAAAAISGSRSDEE